MDDQAEVLERTNGNGESEVIGIPSDDPKELLRQSRELIAVGPRGITPKNTQEAIDLARDLVKAKFGLPEHIKGNVGDMLTLIDLGIRTNMMPSMIANQTYVQNGRLCFQSQLYHALAQASGLMKGDLQVEYEGEGDDLVCIVTGFLRGDPKPRIHRSEKLKDAHPGHVEKTKDGVKAKFVKGSPLWDRKPKVQLFYDTSRDWVRIYCPRATMGIYTPEEIEEYGPEFARDVTPADSGLRERLANSDKSAEGYKPEHVERELAQVAAKDAGSPVGAATPATGDATPREKKRASGVPRAKAGKRQKDTPANEARTTTLVKPSDLPSKAAVKRAADRAEARADKKPAIAEKLPSNVKEYLDYAKAWIMGMDDPKEINARWADERKLRNDLGVTMDDRAPIDEIREARIAWLTD